MFDGAHPLLPRGGEQQVDGGVGHGAGKRVAHKGGSVHKDARLAAADGAGNLLCGQGRRQGEVAPGEGLAQTHDVGADAGPVTGKQLTGATKAGGNLVGNQEHAELVAQGAHPLQVAGVIEAHAARPLDDGF